MKSILGFVFASFLVPLIGFCQDANDSTLIQLSGIVIEADNKEPLPYVTIYQKGSNIGTYSNNSGFFTLVASKGDTIEFKSVGYAIQSFKVPDTLEGFKLSAVVEMHVSSYELQEVVIQPWPTREEFNQAFLALKLEPEQTITNFNYLGFNKLDEIVIPKPTLMNPLSYFYDNVILQLRKKQKKPWKVKDMPKID